MSHKNITGSSHQARRYEPCPNRSINQSPVLLAFHLSHTRPHLQSSFAFASRSLRPTACISHVPTTLTLALPSTPLLAPFLHRASDPLAHLVQTLLRIDRAKGF